MPLQAQYEYPTTYHRKFKTSNIGSYATDWPWSLLKIPEKPDLPKQSSRIRAGDELLGVTQPLIDHIKTFTVDSFRNFHVQDDDGIADADANPTSSSGNVQQDLAEWQQRHATLVLSRVKELSQLRFMLCPWHLKERQFWWIYFMLVKSHIVKLAETIYFLPGKKLV